MFDSKATQKDFSNASGRYAEAAALQARIGAQLVAHAKTYIADDALILDIGAGPGDVTKLWPGRKIALDAAFGMCEEARENGLAAIHARAEKLPVADEAVEVVASNLMLQWLPAPQLFFEEANRVLKPGGILAVANFAKGTLSELTDAFVKIGEPHRVSEFTAQDVLRDTITASGFEITHEAREHITEHYPDLIDLCLYLRDIGATNKRLNRPRGLFTMRRFRQVAMEYPKTHEGLPVSWEVQYVIARKV